MNRRLWALNSIQAVRVAVLAVVLASLLSGCATFYSADAIEGWVVDAETGLPLGGVVVVAKWGMRGLIHGEPVKPLNMLEAVTDEKGRYRFPGWGPTAAFRGEPAGASPALYFLKDGYRYLVAINFYMAKAPYLNSDFNGKTIKLERFAGTPVEYSEHLSNVSQGIWPLYSESVDPCGWERFPRTLIALDAMERQLFAGGARRGTIVSVLRSNNSRSMAKGCRALDDILRQN